MSDRFTYSEADYSTMLREAREIGESDAESDMYYWQPGDPTPEPDLSGQWAVGRTPTDIARAVGWYHYGSAMYDMTDDEIDDYVNGLQDMCDDEYEDAYRERVALLANETEEN